MFQRIATVVISPLETPPTEIESGTLPEGASSGIVMLIWNTPATSVGAAPA
ncbi:MAG: hypothetical protein JWP63_3015 [Candidatus Solibacter sp.]|nr:hypothetical protein [Candidatus Solibacter sp.]